MRSTFVFACVLAALVAASTPARAAFEGNVNVFVGQKWLSESDWGPIEEQPEFGVLLAFAELRAPIHFAIDVLSSSESDTFDDPVLGQSSADARITEYGLGVRKVFRRERMVKPHLGGGGAVVAASLDVTSSNLGHVALSDTNFGFWVDTGLTFRLARHLNLGFDLRYSRSRVEFGNIFGSIRLDTGGFHAGALVGYGW